MVLGFSSKDDGKDDLGFFARLFRKRGSSTRTTSMKQLTPPNKDYQTPVSAASSRTIDRPSFAFESDDRQVRRSISAPVRLVAERRGGIDMSYRQKNGVSRIDEDGVGGVTTHISSNYTALKVMHKGRRATVLRAQDVRSGRWVAIKAFNTVDVAPSVLEQIKTEVAITKKVSEHPGVARVQTTFDEDGQTFLVTEYCSGGTLLEMIAFMGGRIPECVVVEVAATLLSTLEFLHARGIVHRNVKPENLLRTDAGEWKVIDFGTAVEMGLQFCNSRVGSLAYMAPEVLTKPMAADVFHEVIDNGLSEEELPSYNEKSDLWSLGALLFEALTGRQPFLAESPQEMLTTLSTAFQHCTQDGTPNYIARTRISGQAQDFLSKLMQMDPDLRPSAAEMRSHPWLQVSGRHAASFGRRGSLQVSKHVGGVRGFMARLSVS